MGILIQITMKLKNIIRCDRDIFEVLMNSIQDITVTHDFFLVTIAGCCFITDKLPQTCICCADSLDIIGCFGTLHLRNFNQTVKLHRLLLQIKLLPALVFMNLRHKSDNLAIPRTTCQFTIIEVSHKLTLLSPNYK